VIDPEQLATIRVVASALGSLTEQVMFVGGAVVGFFVTDPAAAPQRQTADIDVVVDINSYAEFVRLVDRLRELGFTEDASDGAPTCRWLFQGIKVDVMSSGPRPGPSNRWYAPALAQAQVVALEGDLSARVITAPWFLATKLDAYDDGRRGDILSSRDIEDIVAVIDGRATIVSETRAAPADVAAFLRERFSSLLADGAFIDAIAAHLPGDEASQARISIVLARLRAIAAG
jgi:predicted nucleotidyltransferase